MSIENRIVRRNFNAALREIRQSLRGYMMNYQRVYVGVTSNPERRWIQHSQKEMRKMILLYEAYTPGIATEMERDLIACAKSWNFLIESLNQTHGGDGIVHSKHSHYVYILVA